MKQVDDARAREARRLGPLAHVIWLDEPRRLCGHGRTMVLGVASDAAQRVLDEWAPPAEKAAAA
jgi:hypothetical protein